MKINASSNVTKVQEISVDMMEVPIDEDVTTVEVLIILPNGRPRKLTFPVHYFLPPSTNDYRIR